IRALRCDFLCLQDTQSERTRASSAQISQKAEGKINYWRHMAAQFAATKLMAEESEGRVEEIDGPESYASMKSTSATNIVAEEYESSTTYISSEVGAVTITGDSEEKGDDGCGDTLDSGNSITGKDSQDENADDTTDVSNGKGDDCDGSGGGDDGPRLDVTIKEKEEIQDLNNELETFMAEVKQRFRSHKEELNAVTKKKEEYYEKWQCAETEYTSLKEKYDRRERKYESEIQRVTQSRNEFEAKWESAKKTIKEKELEIQKRMRERMDTIESERKQWGDIIQKLKKEKFQAAITKTRERLKCTS
ncbi:hypothetical protein GBAR_LOCUS16233, partial [Geodia barretti]